jgi:hypothetical protein
LAHEVKIPKRNFCDGLDDIERKDGRTNSTKHDARYVGHHKKLKTNFCLVSLSNARTQIYRLVLELPVLEWSPFVMDMQLALKINVRRNPAALWLAADCFYGRKIFQYPKDMMRMMCSASLSAEWDCGVPFLVPLF